MNLREVPSQLTIAIRGDVDTLLDWSKPCCGGARSRGEHSDDRAQWQDAAQARAEGVRHGGSIGCEGEST